MNAEVHEKILAALEGKDPEIKNIILKALDLSEKTNAESIANNIFREFNSIIKGE
ncbi:hypothetical protein [Geosporobacter ferrireducens]|uniref:hypothetical protein n=1 Tax=Geosporobacter ferrireducens TaxID=1424294 RepID=UPI0023530D47|nr:hypothetical protein [Geosporobacter ferrireducens]